MKTNLNWKKGIFKSTYEIYSEDCSVGYLNEKTWSQSSEGELYGEKYRFKTRGFFNQETQIFTAEDDAPTAKITYNSLRTKARIEYSGKVYFWSYNNIWSTKWSLNDSDGFLINYACYSSRGTIESDFQHNFLILAGLFIRNFYLQASAVVMMVVLLPMWITLFN
jgi:hypothetical protein